MNEIEWEISLTANKLQLEKYFITKSLATGKPERTAFGQTILSQQVDAISAEIKVLTEKRTKGMGGAYTATLKVAATRVTAQGNQVQDYDIIAYIGLLTVLKCIYHAENKKSYLSYIAHAVGKAIEDEQKIYIFKQQHADLLHTMRNDIGRTHLDKQKLELHRVQRTWKEQDHLWESWGNKALMHIGMRVIRAILAVMDEYILLKRITTPARREQTLVPSKAMHEFLAEHTEYILGTTVTSQPCIEPPLDWECNNREITGGFHTLEMSNNRPYVKFKAKEQKDWFFDHIPHRHIKAVNYIQGVGHKINENVLELIKISSTNGLFPEHIPHLVPPNFPAKPEDELLYDQWKKDRFNLVRLNKRRITKLAGLQRVISTAETLRDREFWCVHSSDFTGRIYCSSGSLSIQSTDYVKALIQFSKGKPLGRTGLLWLAVHGANTYGYNTDSFSGRYRWVMDNMERIRDAALEPTGSTGKSFIGNAKHPFQFYAFCCEWTEAHSKQGNPEAFISHLPVAIDGSGNGFQHYSALLRDQTGATRTNLTRNQLPEDVYTHIAGKLKDLLTHESDNPLAATLLKGGIDRDLIKVPVMTIPYGISIRGLSLELYSYLNDNAEKYSLIEGDLKNWTLITYLTEKLLEVVTAEIPAPSIVMKWLQGIAQSISMEDHLIKWISPIGFPVCQPYMRYRENEIQTELNGTKRIVYKDKAIGVERKKSKVALAPNFIHTLDSSHLVLVALRCEEKDDMDIQVIHDELATHAADMIYLHRFVQEEFYELHSPNILSDFRKQMQELIDYIKKHPEQGSYRIEEVLSAPHLFH